MVGFLFFLVFIVWLFSSFYEILSLSFAFFCLPVLYISGCVCCLMLHCFFACNSYSTCTAFCQLVGYFSVMSLAFCACIAVFRLYTCLCGAVIWLSAMLVAVGCCLQLGSCSTNHCIVVSLLLCCCCSIGKFFLVSVKNITQKKL